MNSNSSDYFVNAIHCCVCSAPSRYCPGKDILRGFTVPFMFSSIISCEFIDF